MAGFINEVKKNSNCNDVECSYDLDQFHELRDGNGKASAIVRSIMAIVSIIASSLLIWMIRRSYIGFTNTFHRVLFGLCVADILYSLGSAHFNFTAPVDMNYVVWNARGNQTSCSIQGFITGIGISSGLLYTCSLNIYYVVVVKQKKADAYIRKYIEPYLLIVPIFVSLVYGITLLVMQNFNVDDFDGMCIIPTYNPYHCSGMEDGEVKMGFNIPCGRGKDGAVTFGGVMAILLISLTPIVTGVSLSIVYLTVRIHEKRDPNRRCKSRTVLNQAIAFSISYLLTWGFIFINTAMSYSGSQMPTVTWYIASIMNPLQGVFNFIIYMHPMVLSKIQEQPGTTWWQAITYAIWSRGVDNRRGVVRQQNLSRDEENLNLHQAEQQIDELTPNVTAQEEPSPFYYDEAIAVRGVHPRQSFIALLQSPLYYDEDILLIINDHTIQHIASYLDYQEIARLALTCRRFGASEKQYNNLSMMEEAAHQLFNRAQVEERNALFARLRNSRFLQDQIRIHELLIASLFRAGKFPEAIEHVRSVLGTLGFPLPASVDANTVKTVLEAMRNAASSFTPEQMRTFPLMTDEVPKLAMKIMGSVPIMLTFVSPTFSAMIACQMTQLTIQRGLCPASAVAFANLGFAINSVFQDFNCGYAMGNLGLAIFQRFQLNALILKTFLPIFGFLKMWNEPCQSASEGLSYAIGHKGSLAGDRDRGSACSYLARTVLHRQLLLNGYSLSELRMMIENLCREMMHDKQPQKFGSFLYQNLGNLYTIISFTGEPDEQLASTFFSRDECEKAMLELYSSSKNAGILQLFYYHRFMQSFSSRDFEIALIYCEEYDKIGNGVISRTTDIAITFYSGVIGFVLARRTKRDGMFELGERRLISIQAWADHGSKWNAENKALLLQAEKCYSNGSLDEAKYNYEASIKSAREHKFIHEEAFAYEMYGIFRVKTGHFESGEVLLRKAQSLYAEWGAMKMASEVLRVGLQMEVTMITECVPTKGEK